MSVLEPDFTFGIEEEYHLVDLETRDLASTPPPELLTRCVEKLGNRVSPEFLRSQIEIGTSVCKSIDEARKELKFLRSTISSVACDYNMDIIAASTHPFGHWSKQQHVDKERYNIIAEDLGVVVRRLSTCGMHVHVGIGDEDTRIDLFNQIAYFLPHMLALSTSSPFWQGEDTGLKSYRLAVFDELPRTGPPPKFDSFGEYQRSVATMVRAGLIEDGTKIWWDLRPSARFPTIEMRICDVCPLVEDALAITALFLCTCRMLYRLRRQNQRWRQYRAFLVQENRWLAQRYGFERGLLDLGKAKIIPFKELLHELVELVSEDVEYLDCRKEIRHAYTILQRGTSADRQLATYKNAIEGGKSGSDALSMVVDELIAETKYA
jgi:carboxylate-amine ligase